MHASSQPAGTGPRWGAQWRDPGMAASYVARHAYPPETFDVLADLWDGSHPVCEIGAGNGRVTAGLADRIEATIDAIEPSSAMIAAAPAPLPRVRWINATFEAADVTGPYGLVVAAESIHWTDWSTSFARIRSLLAVDAMLALVGLLESAAGAAAGGSQPWLPAVQAVIAEFATSDEYVPYDCRVELRDRLLFDEIGTHITAWHRRTTPVADVIRRYHSMNGLSTDRLGDRTTAFDAAMRAALEPHAVEGDLHCEVAADIRWGHPLG